RNSFRIAATASSSPGFASHSAETISSLRSELAGIVSLRIDWLRTRHQRADTTERATSNGNESSTLVVLSGVVEKHPARALAGGNDDRLRQLGAGAAAAERLCFGKIDRDILADGHPHAVRHRRIERRAVGDHSRAGLVG